MAKLTSRERKEMREAVVLTVEGYLDDEEARGTRAGIDALESGSIKLGLFKPGELEKRVS